MHKEFAVFHGSNRLSVLLYQSIFQIVRELPIMSEDRSLSVKVYLDVGGGRQEVRRFGMPEGLATNFTCLKDKVCAVFGLGNADITLSWTG